MYVSGTRKKPTKTRSALIRVCIHLFEEILSDYLKITGRPESGP